MDKISLINNTFKDISEVTNNRFVTIRNYDLIPSLSSMENDIDLLITPIFIQPLVEKLKPYGYNVYQDNSQCLYGAQPHIHFKHPKLDVHLDITTGLYYRSIADTNIFVNINSKLTRQMVNNRLNVNKPYLNIPHPNDELVHLICHCIFDKRKTTDRYKEQIISLLPSVDTDKIYSMLSLIFYKATDTIYKKLINKDVDNLFNDYITFKNY